MLLFVLNSFILHNPSDQESKDSKYIEFKPISTYLVGFLSFYRLLILGFFHKSEFRKALWKMVDKWISFYMIYSGCYKESMGMGDWCIMQKCYEVHL